MPKPRDLLREDDAWDEPMLPLGSIDTSSGSMESDTVVRAARPVKAAGYGSCPGCTAGKVALESRGKHLVWRLHNLRTWSGAPMQCRTGGARLCDAPDAEMQIKCLCENTPGWLH